MNRQLVNKAQKTNNPTLLPPTGKLQRKTINQAGVASTVDIRGSLEQQIEASSLSAKGSHFNHDFSKIAVRLNSPYPVQAKLKIGQPNDRYEQEADQFADQVMRMPEGQLSGACACGEVCPNCQANQFGHGREQLYIKSLKPSDSRQIDAPAIVHKVLQSPGQSLDLTTRGFMESRFGHDFSRVQVHTDEKAAESAHSIGARAYTVGHHVIFAGRQYQPLSPAGKKLLAHELTHVLQQEKTSNADRIQRFLTCEPESDCPVRVSGEGDRSRRNPMELHRITSGGIGMMISNFAVDSSDLKEDPSTNPAWDAFMRGVSSSSHLRWEILGFTDCQGDEGHNISLRAARASSLYLTLPSHVQRQVDTYHAAPADQCIHPNSTELERSLNRSALIWLQSTTYDENDFSPERVQGDNRRNVYICSKSTDTARVPQHAFFRLDAPGPRNETISLQPMQVNMTSDCWQGIPDWNYPSDYSAAGTCTLTAIDFGDLYNQFQAYPIGHYCTLGPNSNTFVGYIARNLGITNPDPAGWTPGIDASPPPSGTFAPNTWETLARCRTIECIAGAEGPGDRESA